MAVVQSVVQININLLYIYYMYSARPARRPRTQGQTDYGTHAVALAIYIATVDIARALRDIRTYTYTYISILS